MVYQIQQTSEKSLEIDYRGVSYRDRKSLAIETDIHGGQKSRFGLLQPLGVGFLFRGMLVWEKRKDDSETPLK